MIPKGCKRLEEEDFPIAGVFLNEARDWPAARQARAVETESRLQEPIQNPARFQWNEVTKVADYYLSVDALTKPMRVQKDSPLHEENLLRNSVANGTEIGRPYSGRGRLFRAIGTESSTEVMP